jgi:hypothetical protein
MKDTNTPAFPQVDHYGRKLTGMTLRDYFAAKAMQALITNEVIHSVTMKEANKAGIPEEFAVAQMSFMVADAMMKARDET